MAVQFETALVLVVASAVSLCPLCLELVGRNAANHGEGIPHPRAETRCFGPYSKAVADESRSRALTEIKDNHLIACSLKGLRCHDEKMRVVKSRPAESQDCER